MMGHWGLGQSEDKRPEAGPIRDRRLGAGPIRDLGTETIGGEERRGQHAGPIREKETSGSGQSERSLLCFLSSVFPSR
ncbi:UNVERIFIED_CONTAM: hypothetical protein FKN15_016514 [Acipenser sinensis]